ncbi:MAG: hypothetical protein PHE29_02030 [Tissierellia bacterium]|nr:hypothetical protein [Tissierellia bacterium]
MKLLGVCNELGYKLFIDKDNNKRVFDKDNKEVLFDYNIYGETIKINNNWVKSNDK